ncbi:MAG: hypothetical protein A2X09_09230 [Bacteroidetes bacterium GWF2_43_11]|nr:MAG: hypothetical protein A2X09_09230 [Bacteroidetes bacterium GWF2_43_11]
MKKFLLFSFILAAGLTSCRKDSEVVDPTIVVENKTIDDLKVSSSFNFTTDVLASVDLLALANDGQPLKGVKFSLYTDYPDNGGKLMVTGITGADGRFTANYPIPAYLEQVVVLTPYIGLPHDVQAPVLNGRIAYTFGGITQVMKSSGIGVFKAAMINFYYMGTYNSQGVPNYLEAPNEVIDPAFLADINNSFPEGIPMNPEYLLLSNEHDFKLTEACDVWVVFVSEGAGYRNTLGYYTYDLNNPPQSPADIDSGLFIFPNVSATGSSGGLNTGNKVYLGQFPGGTGIGFFLKSDAWRNNGTVGSGNYTFYSDPDLNPETIASKRKHNVVMVDYARDLFLMGFEDLNRQTQDSDEDFNDAIFLVKANPIENVETGGFPVPDYTGQDTDGDGIPDCLEDYPYDPTRAFNNYYPAEGQNGTLAFEDLWPAKGDYDFNDVVVDYNINQITNADNKVVEVKPTFILRATGATYKNGFGFQLNIAPNQIASITGQHLTDNYINLNANGTESGQANAAVMVFDNAYTVLQYPGSGEGINTTSGAPTVEPVTMSLDINLSQPVTTEAFGYPPYNSFIISNKIRGREVHLPNQAPTSLADPSLFGTADDNSNTLQGRYYKTINNLPWAINVIESFDYPTESTQITEAHLKFGPWAESSGTQYADWFQDKAGYRNTANIY